MSFDLYFFWRKQKSIDFDLIAEWSAQISHFRRDDKTLWYKNENTGVYFSIDFETKDQEEESIVPAEWPNYFDSGLSFNLNYNRPTFFATEAMAIATDLATKFDLTIYDNQQHHPNSPEQNPTDSELINSWCRSNVSAVSYFRGEKSSLPYMPLATSQYLWAYSYRKEELQKKLGEDVFVPKLVPFRRLDSQKAETVFVCTLGNPMVIPKSDWVIFARPQKRLLGSGKDTETVVINRTAFDSTAGTFSCSLPGTDMEVRAFNQEAADKAAKALKSARNVLPPQEFELLSFDGFVDVENDLTI